ncbi:MAG TPA: ABC transporter ATP-binding protein [Pseudogracilibacillus sp.]|nr:ABC transporter ATP-binding protein [Pseudogracilibacillus sp.]
MEQVVTMEGVSKRFKGFTLNNIDLQVRKGFITGFIGANGAGKSTTIKLMMNLLKPDQGEIEVFGMNYESKEKEIKQRIGFVHDTNVFYDGLNLKDIRRIVSPAYYNWNNNVFNEYIERFELPLNRPLKRFSKGMQMKASLAVALAHEPELIIMDEPTSGLDPIFRRELMDLLQELMTNEERTIFFSTHITSDLERVSDYVAFIHQGEMVFHYPTDQIEERYKLVKGSVDLLDSDTEQAFIHVRSNASGFEALTEDEAVVREIFGDSVVVEPASLEAIMYYVKGGVQND